MSERHVPAAELEGWVRQVADLYGLNGDVDAQRDTERILDLVRDVGKAVARPAGPLTVFLLGVAAGRAAPAGTAVTSHVQHLIEQAEELMRRHADGHV